MNSFTVVKMNGRHRGYPQWKYYAEFRWKNHPIFSLSRAWCWETWGPSTEISIMPLLPSTENIISNACYTWDWNDQHKRIYFKSDLELNLFTLKWA